MSWTDEEIDNLFKGAANAQSFEYNDAYFSEIEAALPVNKKGGKDFLWMGTALLFIAVLTTGYFVSNTGDASFDNGSDQLAKAELNNNEQSNQTKAASTTNTNANQSALVDNAQIEITSENVSNDVVASNLLGSNAKNIAMAITFTLFSLLACAQAQVAIAESINAIGALYFIAGLRLFVLWL